MVTCLSPFRRIHSSPDPFGPTSLTKSHRTIIAQGALPISATSELAWIGFTDSGIPVTVDSMEVVRMLQLGKSPLWVPVAELMLPKEKVGHVFWCQNDVRKCNIH